MLACYHARLREQALDYVIFGHIGDAHVHVNILPKSQADFETGQRLMLEFARQAVALGGTVSAEHGLGKRKAHLLELQYTPRSNRSHERSQAPPGSRTGSSTAEHSSLDVATLNCVPQGRRGCAIVTTKS